MFYVILRAICQSWNSKRSRRQFRGSVKSIDNKCDILYHAPRYRANDRYKNITRALATGSVITLLSTAAASAGNVVYQPVNPSFGGSPLNSTHLLGLADRQNLHTETSGSRGSSISSVTGTSQADLFVRNLQSRLLSSLAGQVTEAIFGEDPQDQGEIVFGSTTVTFERGLEYINLTIFDAVSGSTTEVQVPILQTE